MKQIPLTPKRFSPLQQTATVGVVMLVIVTAIVMLRQQMLLVQQQQQVHSRIDLYAGFLQDSIDRLLGDHEALLNYAQENLNQLTPLTDQERSQLETYAAGLHADSNWVRAYQIVDDGIIRFTYPLRGNESALNYDLLRDAPAVVSADVRLGIRTGEMTITGPVQLVQGTQGFIIRRRVSGDEQHSRLVAIVFDLSRLLEESGMLLSEAGELSLAVQNDKGGLVSGEEAVLHRSPQTQVVDLVAQKWIVAGVPQNGWGVVHRGQLLATTAAGLLITALSTLLTWVVSSRHADLSAAVNRGTEDLRIANEQLVRDVFLRTQTEEALREAMKRLRSVFDQAAVGLVVVGVESGIVVEWNRYLAELLGWDATESVDRPLTQLVAPAFRHELQHSVEQV
ncbi:MAG: CHASE domain-containing protein, partial [Planctomycetaceae bacterium]|nr:CHASE domain-containing protein [Planctomycetaceae bacterium]